MENPVQISEDNLSSNVTKASVSLWDQVMALVEMCKFRMILMIWVTVAFGYLLADGFSVTQPSILIFTLIGSGLTAAGSFYHNQYLEADVDALMPRTKNRPLPTGKFSSLFVLVSGLVLEIAGLLILHLFVGPLPLLLTAFIALSYVLVYTPLKRLTWFNTTIGAVPGAIPPMVGWAAVTGELSLVPWVLFAVMVIWQHPHFYAIGWLYREDYRMGGIKVLPAMEEKGFWTSVQTVFFAAALLPVSWSLYWAGVVGTTYFIGVTLAGAIYLTHSIWFGIVRDRLSARQLLFASLIYLPVFLLVLSLDARFG